MVAVLATLLFLVAFAASLWAMYITIEPRLGYMRVLLNGGTIPELAPTTAARMRNVTRSAAVSTMPRSIRAAA